MLVVGISATAQIVHEKISDYDFYKTMIPKYGPNGKFFVYPEFSFSMFTPAITGYQIPIKYFNSFKTSAGANFKLRFTNWLSVGTDIKINFEKYNLPPILFSLNEDENSINPCVPSRAYKKIYQIGTSPYIRFNYGRRGNTIGKYIDFAFSTNYTFLAKDIIKFKENGIRTQYSYNTTPSYKLTYAMNTRFGFRWWAILISYRINNYYQNYSTLLPKLSVGIQLAISK